MAKKRIVGLILSSFLAVGALLFSHSSRNNDVIAKADDLVGTPEVSWNNIDWSPEMGESWVPNIDSNKVPQSGYCLLALYPEHISLSNHTDENLITSSLEGCNVKTHVLINGVQSQNVDDVIIYAYPENGLFIYVPHSSIAFSDEYEYLTINVLEGMSIDGSAQTVATRFEYRGLLGSSGNWLVNPEPIEKVKGEFHSISWNNVDYSYDLDWCGGIAPSGAPENGYCLLAFFNEEGKTPEESTIGTTYTQGRGVIGLGYNADYKIKVNGVNIIDVEDSVCYIYPKYGLFFYIPEASLTYNDEYLIPTITLEKGVRFNNVVLPYISFEFRGELEDTNCWTYIKDESEYSKPSFVKVAEKWNNTQADASHTQTILQFGEYEVDYLKKDRVSDFTNLVNRYSDVGTKITVNGKSLWELGDALVSYAHGYCYVYFVLPMSALNPSNGYKVVTLHIANNTMFYDSLLPEVNLYLFKGEWITTRPETPEDSDYNNAYSLSSAFGRDNVVLDSNNRQITGNKECSVNSFGLSLDYKLISKDSAFVLYALGTTNQNGIRVVVRDNGISLYDATEGNISLGEMELSPFEYDEWYSLLIYTSFSDNKLSICVAVDDITYIHATNVNLSNPNNLGNSFSVTLGSGEAKLKNSTPGADIKKPTLTYTGKALYAVLVGTEPIDFKNKCSAYDVVDGDVTKYITFNYPEYSLTNNRLNKGIWDIEIIASDKSHNTSKMSVTVVVVDKLEVTVTFDGSNPFTYKVGDHIAPISDPVKEGDGVNSYRFIGWYYLDRLWDFENDYVISDMNLISKYQQTVEEYLVSFDVEGINGVNSYTMYFAYGTELSMQYFSIEGYSLKAYLNDEEVESIRVTQNMNVKLVYSSNKKEGDNKKKCGGDIMMTSIILSSLSLFGIVLVSLKKKGGKEHE